MTRHITIRITYVFKGGRPQYTDVRWLWSEDTDTLGGAMHGVGEGLPSPLPLLPSSPYPRRRHQQSQNKSAGLGAILESPTSVLGASLGAPCRRGGALQAQTLSPAGTRPWESPWTGGGWGLGGRAAEGGAAAGPGRCRTGHPAGPGEQEQLRKHPLSQAKLQRRDKPVFLCRRPDVGPLRTDSRCWGRTAAAGRWRGRSWHL